MFKIRYLSGDILLVIVFTLVCSDKTFVCNSPFLFMIS